MNALIAKDKAYVNRCVSLNKSILPYLSTANVARDMDGIRAAMGDKKLNYFGFSYGTFLGATYASLFPGNYRSMVLDGPVDANSQNCAVTLSKVAGAVRATSGTGSVTAIELTSTSVVARSMDGDVDVAFAFGTPPPDLVTATSGTGSIDLGLPAGPQPGAAPYQVHDQSATGRVTTAVATDPTSRHIVRATSQNGDVTVHYVRG